MSLWISYFILDLILLAMRRLDLPTPMAFRKSESFFDSDSFHLPSKQ